MTLKMNQIILLNVLRFINKKFDTLRAIDLFEKKLIHCIYVYFWILINTNTAFNVQHTTNLQAKKSFQ